MELRVDMHTLFQDLGHAHPVPGPRPHHRTSRRIDNELSIAFGKRLVGRSRWAVRNQAAVVADRAADCDLGPFELTQPRC